MSAFCCRRPLVCSWLTLQDRLCFDSYTFLAFHGPHQHDGVFPGFSAFHGIIWQVDKLQSSTWDSETYVQLTVSPRLGPLGCLHTNAWATSTVRTTAKTIFSFLFEGATAWPVSKNPRRKLITEQRGKTVGNQISGVQHRPQEDDLTPNSISGNARSCCTNAETLSNGEGILAT